MAGGGSPPAAAARAADRQVYNFGHSEYSLAYSAYYKPIYDAMNGGSRCLAEPDSLLSLPDPSFFYWKPEVNWSGSSSPHSRSACCCPGEGREGAQGPRGSQEQPEARIHNAAGRPEAGPDR